MPSSAIHRFFLLFGIELTAPVQLHLVLPWTILLAQACVATVTEFDANAAAIGKVLWNPVSGFGVLIEPGCNGVEACIILCAAIVACHGLLDGLVASAHLGTGGVVAVAGSLIFCGGDSGWLDQAHHENFETVAATAYYVWAVSIFHRT